MTKLYHIVIGITIFLHACLILFGSDIYESDFREYLVIILALAFWTLVLSVVLSLFHLVKIIRLKSKTILVNIVFFIGIVVVLLEYFLFRFTGGWGN